MAKTVDVIKKAKIDLEASVTKLFQDFEKTHGVKLGYIDIKHKRIPMKEKDQIDAMVDCCGGRFKDGKIIDTDIDIRFPKE